MSTEPENKDLPDEPSAENVANDAPAPSPSAPSPPAPSVTPPPTAAARPIKEGQKPKDGKRKKKDGLWHGTIRPILEVVVVVFLLRALIIDWNDVPSGSMLPTIQIGDRIAVNRLAYGLNLPVPFLRHDRDGNGFLDLPFTNATVPLPLPGQVIRWSDPKRGDIVIVWSPQEDGPLGTRLVKRVVAVPGDTVQVVNGQLIINGTTAEYEPLDAPFVQIADGGVRRNIQAYTESFPELDFTHVMQMPVAFPPGRSYDEVQQSLFNDAYRVASAMPGVPAGTAQQKAAQDTLDELRRLAVPPALHDSPARTLGEGEYMCMGDNRQYSNDCRVFGPVSRKQIVGRAFAVAFSFKDGQFSKPDFGRFFKGLD